ncbi:hypothetical protein NEHOM01_1158 [Nematocida homosporus]|uniref:uncharacterized protein n=1 Tax=Nematocida homosporus TaxID=1912981 RepID=UPI00221F4755|nr:uncharacterized protein NEHOM01_1158 [Nematocida homosporus]KAI5185908.1 hypothetical protein NEHOM01_1158 [Nematocida homosporus]
MDRGIRVVGKIDTEVRRWVEEVVNRNDKNGGRKERLVAVGKAISGLGKIVRVEEPGWWGRIVGRPTEVVLQGTKYRMNGGVGMDKTGKKQVTAKVEVPNWWSSILGINTVSVSGSRNGVKGSLGLGIMNKNWIVGEEAVYHWWRGEMEVSSGLGRVLGLWCRPGFENGQRLVGGVEVLRRENRVESWAKMEWREVLAGTKRLLRLDLGRESTWPGGKWWVDGRSYLRGLGYGQAQLGLGRFSSSWLNWWSVGGGGGGDLVGKVFMDSRIKVEGKAGVNSLCRPVGEASASLSLYVVLGQIGVFVGGLVSGKKLEGDQTVVDKTPMFGVSYTGTGNWLDSIDCLWSISEIQRTKGLFNKLGSMSITLGKEY